MPLTHRTHSRTSHTRIRTLAHHTQIIFRFVDMGITLSEFLDDIVSSNGEVGTSGYHAPEILTQQAYNYKSDVFMLGVTFCLLVSDTCIVYMCNAFYIGTSSYYSIP